MGRRGFWAGSSVRINDKKALRVLNELRDKAMADHRARESQPVVDSRVVAGASIAALGLPELRP